MPRSNMMYEIGTQYEQDDRFKAAARLHQSRYRSTVLNVDYSEYGNQLTEKDAQSLMNYYASLNVTQLSGLIFLKEGKIN